MCQFPSVYFVPYDLFTILASFSLTVSFPLNKLAFLPTYIGSVNADIIHVLSLKVQVSVLS